MFEGLQKVRDAVAGKKTYITAAIGILTALVAWGGGELTDWQAIAAIWVALQIIFVRSGNKKDVADRVDVVNVHAFQQAFDAGVDEANDQYQLGFMDGFDDGEDYARYEDE